MLQVSLGKHPSSGQASCSGSLTSPLYLGMGHICLSLRQRRGQREKRGTVPAAATWWAGQPPL